ncbi:MAG: TIGR03936 family radical SAM-associated protein [Propionibacteriaceae bacterium]|jgi:radical SAM-linked protein|nr:TIGR03936 family radical SAM-associated protein [Propionibacteriaceae bacterium]
MSRQPPVQQPPPVCKLLVKYGRIGRARFASHRDFARIFERALRRAEIDMAYSSGFHPHPRLSYINPAFTGSQSRAEFLVIGLRTTREPELVLAELGAAMPEGFPILEVILVEKMPVFTASWWEVDLEGATPTILESAYRELTSGTEPLLVTRETKSGPRQFDVRPALRSVEVTSTGLRLLLTHEPPLVRPDDVVTALGLTLPARFLRVAQLDPDTPIDK